MSIEKVKMLKTIQLDRECWEVGEILPRKPGEPLHPILLDEILKRTGSVEVLSYTKDSVLEKSNLQQPLSDNTLVEAQRREKEALKEKEKEKERADKLLIEKREMMKAVEDLQVRFEALSTMVSGFQKRLDEEDTALIKREKRLRWWMDLVESLSKKVADHLEKDTKKKEDAPSSEVSGKKALVKRKIVVKRKK